ncbi:hypothetical protein AVEN_39001-1 [Araneus ventricosus]|uniref:FLYWCH-type domain-containing protein n=1 Tax=Araneus ventricosus TaxID=182803 RepID=A0A4Y2DN41_ARAVE|nr:hypothetical protein AVEN_39001-1 [Araneus ventricosus]
MNYLSVIRPQAGQLTQPQSCAFLHGVDWMWSILTGGLCRLTRGWSAKRNCTPLDPCWLGEEYKKGNKRWLCRSRRCNGSLITSSDETVIMKEQGHSCAPDDAKIDVEKMKEQGLRRCRD